MENKKNVLIYDKEKMRRAGQLLNMITISGVNNIRALAEISYILDSGEPAEIEDKKEEKADVDLK